MLTAACGQPVNPSIVERCTKTKWAVRGMGGVFSRNAQKKTVSINVGIIVYKSGEVVKMTLL